MENIISSPDFEASISRLQRQITQWKEGPRLDFKVELYKLNSKEEQFKFSIDIIAFANIARRIGKPCWVIFGVDDLSHDITNKGLQDEFPRHVKPENWEDREVPVSNKYTLIQDAYRQTIMYWITPEPSISYEYGLLDGEFLSYLEINPDPSSEPFKLNKNSPSKRNKDGSQSSPIKKGTIYLRRCSSTVRLQDSEAHRYLLSGSEAAYISRKGWQELINYYQVGQFLEAKDFPSNYNILCNNGQNRAEERVLDMLNENHRCIIIKGNPGTGKSLLLKRLTCFLAEKHSSEVHTVASSYGNPEEDNVLCSNSGTDCVIKTIDDFEVYPDFPVPVFLELRFSLDNIQEFKERLVSKIKEACKKESLKSLESVFAIPFAQWVVILDGLDELRNRENAAEKIRGWIDILPPNVKVIIASRPRYVDFPGTNYQSIEITNLCQEGAKEVLEYRLSTQIIDDENVKSDRINKIKDAVYGSDVLNFLVNLRSIAGLVSYLTGSPPESIAPIDRPIVEVTSPVEPPLNFSFR